MRANLPNYLEKIRLWSVVSELDGTKRCRRTHHLDILRRDASVGSTRKREYLFSVTYANTLSVTSKKMSCTWRATCQYVTRRNKENHQMAASPFLKRLFQTSPLLLKEMTSNIVCSQFLFKGWLSFGFETIARLRTRLSLFIPIIVFTLNAAQKNRGETRVIRSLDVGNRFPFSRLRVSKIRIGISREIYGPEDRFCFFVC